MSTNSITYDISGSVSIDCCFFPLLWVVCLVVFGWMPQIGNLLCRCEYFCIPINITEVCYGVQLLKNFLIFLRLAF